MSSPAIPMPKYQFLSTGEGCRICYQTTGNPSDPAILLVSGGQSAMTQKSDWLMAGLNTSSHPHYIIRFDNRDNGLSTSFTKTSEDIPVYTLSDMVSDAVALITHLNLSSVHIVGPSFGGPIAWSVAARLPGKVRSLTLLYTSPTGKQVSADDKLPAYFVEGGWLVGDVFAEHMPESNDRENDEAWIKLYTALSLSLSTKPPTEEEKEEARRESEVTFYREKTSGTAWTKSNQSDAGGPRWPREKLRDVKCETLIVHAVKDQFIPRAHSEALRDEIEGATLVDLEDCGHEFPMRVRQTLVDLILDNVKKGEQKSRG
ncbi:alpha/beta-hydrolase [Astrocystis sublimbata]|nr:alpha/beta-hydrolase [Astrocystis sublimbata]